MSLTLVKDLLDRVSPDQLACCEHPIEVPSRHTLEVVLVNGESIVYTTPCDQPMFLWQSFSEVALMACADGYEGQFTEIKYIRSVAMQANLA